MPTRTLPPRPSLHQLKIQANELHRAHRDRDRIRGRTNRRASSGDEGLTARGGARQAAGPCGRAARRRPGVRLPELGRRSNIASSRPDRSSESNRIPASTPHWPPWTTATSIACAPCLRRIRRLFTRARTSIRRTATSAARRCCITSPATPIATNRFPRTSSTSPASCWTLAPTCSLERSDRTAATRWDCWSRASRPATWA